MQTQPAGKKPTPVTAAGKSLFGRTGTPVGWILAELGGFLQRRDPRRVGSGSAPGRLQRTLQHPECRRQPQCDPETRHGRER